MDPVHEREAAIFDAALDLPPDQRAAHLDRACGGDAALRERMECLLKACDSSCVFLDSPAAPVAPASTMALPSSIERPGDTIGRYKLLQKIGEGGCGVVYMAEQTEPVRRRVALKIIKLGMDTKSVIARFEAERQALAMMDHPNIAKVFDAGSTERRLCPSPSPGGGEGQSLAAGRPYFVMELVRGMKITEYCDEAKLSTRARLELFIQVCQAIQHAHQKGIIHRDIKPSNILVTVDNGVPVPKVIDFGIAKATSGQQLTDKTLFTAFEQFIGTPAYMSPEQAVLTSLDIDTRSDVYALGVLLYEMLTGRTPFDAKELLAIGLDEMRRTIREREPQRPSTRVSTLAQNERSTTAQRRGIEAPRLVIELRGDLDWIVMKALEKDRTRRYETANALAMDLQRHMNHEPVFACPPSRLYRFRKMVRRNRLVFAAGLAVSAALVIGLGLSTWMFFGERTARREQAQLRQEAQAAQRSEATLRREAEAARASEASLRLQAQAGEKRAATEAAKSQTVAQFLKDMLQSIRPSVALGRDTTLLRETVDKTAERLGQDLADQPDVRAELETTLAQVYQVLGEKQKAERMQRKALATRRETLGDESAEVARALNSLALILWEEGEGTGAKRRRDERLAMGGTIPSDEAPGQPRPDAETYGRELGQAEWLHRQALGIRRKVLGNDHAETTESLNNLALVLRRTGKLEEAELLHREALEIRKKVLTAGSLPIADSHHNLAVVLRDEGRLAEAEALFRAALAMRRKLLDTSDPDVAATVHGLTDVLQRQDNVAGVESLFRDELTHAVRRSTNNPLLKSDPVYQMLDAVLAHRRYAQADQLVNELLTPAVEREPTNAGLLRVRGEFLARRGRWDEAAADLAEVIKLDPETHDPWYFLAPLLSRSGAIDAYRHHCHRMLLRLGGTILPGIAETTAKSCLLLPVSGSDFSAATGLAQTAVAAGLDHPFVLYFRFTKGLAEYRLQHYAIAEDWLRRCVGLSDRLLETQARLVLAMTHQQLQKTNEARYGLWDAVSMAKEWFPEPGASDYGADWPDVLILHSLLNEARALVGNGETDERNRVFSQGAAADLTRQGKLLEAETAWREVLARYKVLFGPDHLLLVAPLDELANVLWRQQKRSEAEVPVREAVRLLEEHNQQRVLLDALSYLAGLLREQGKLEAQEAVSRKALAVARSLFGDESLDIADSLNNLAVVLRNQGKLAEAEAIHREALTMRKRLRGDEHLDVVQSLLGLAGALFDQGKVAEAEDTLRQAMPLARKALGSDHQYFPRFLLSLARVLQRQAKPAEAEITPRKNLDEARSLAEEAVALYQRHSDWNSIEAAEALQVLRNVLTDQRDFDQLDAMLPKHAQFLQARLPSNDPQFAGALAWLVIDLLGREKFVEAEPLARECLAIRERNAPDDWRTFSTQSMLGASLLGQKKYAEAEPPLRSGYEGMTQREDQIPPLGRLRLGEALQRLVHLYEGTGRREEAAEWRQKLAEFEQKEEQRRTAIARKIPGPDSNSKTNSPSK